MFHCSFAGPTLQSPLARSSSNDDRKCEKRIAPPTQKITEIGSSFPKLFSTLLFAFDAADLAGTLSGQGPFTVFAPTDKAFEDLPAGTIDFLLANKDVLKQVLLYHGVSGKIMSTDVTMVGQTAPTLAGFDVTVTSLDPLKINGVNVIVTDVLATNGVVHVIDKVLIPPGIV